METVALGADLGEPLLLVGRDTDPLARLGGQAVAVLLRLLIGARDGSAISVTLLSSDIGKLYVALAQAIDRLRG